MTELLLIADDLTGALDGAVAFVAAGVEVYPLPGQVPSVAELERGARVVAVNASTRHLEPGQAAAVVSSLACAARKAGVRVVLKKTDSALRGNVGAELAAAREVLGGTAHFVPAYPELGRITRGGVHYVDGVPVGESSFGRDPFEPVRHSSVPDVIASQSDVETLVVAEGGSAPEGLEGVAVYDAATQGEVDALAGRLLAGSPVLLAGCAGLAAGVARALGLAGLPAPELPHGNVAALCGSVNPASVAQCAFAEAAGAPVWVVTEDQKKDAAWPQTPAFSTLVSAVAESWDARPLTVVDASAYTPPADGSSPSPAVRDRVAANLGALARGVALTRGRADGCLLVMGGDVLLALVEAARARTLRILGEVTTGVVVSELSLGNAVLNVMSKSGGFGEENLFQRVSERLSGSPRAFAPDARRTS